MLALESEINQAATVQSYMSDLSKEWLEKKGTYDIDASDAKITDFFNTLEKNPESFYYEKLLMASITLYRFNTTG